MVGWGCGGSCGIINNAWYLLRGSYVTDMKVCQCPSDARAGMDEIADKDPMGDTSVYYFVDGWNRSSNAMNGYFTNPTAADGRLSETLHAWVEDDYSQLPFLVEHRACFMDLTGACGGAWTEAQPPEQDLTRYDGATAWEGVEWYVLPGGVKPWQMSDLPGRYMNMAFGDGHAEMIQHVTDSGTDMTADPANGTLRRGAY